MSKSKRVFLTIMGDDDFWGNGNGIESTTTTAAATQKINEDDDEEEEEDEEEEVKKRKSKIEQEKSMNLMKNDEDEAGDFKINVTEAEVEAEAATAADEEEDEENAAYFFKKPIEMNEEKFRCGNENLMASPAVNLNKYCINSEFTNDDVVTLDAHGDEEEGDSGKDESLLSEQQHDDDDEDEDDDGEAQNTIQKTQRNNVKGDDDDDDDDNEDDGGGRRHVEKQKNAEMSPSTFLQFEGGDVKSEQKDSGAASIDSNDTYHVGFRNFLQNRPDAEIRAFIEGPFQLIDDKFFEAYEKIRRELENSPNSHVVQQLRRSLPSVNAYRFRSKHAVVVSSFREPDRRLGRYSKYYYHHNVGPEVYSRKVFVGGLPACVTEVEILMFFSRFGRLQVDWPSKHYVFKSDSDPTMETSDATTLPPAPTSHLAQLSPPFGQINPFLARPPTLMPSERCSPPSQVDVSTTPGSMMLRDKKQQHPGYVFLLFEKERSVRDLVAECYEEEEGLFIMMEDFVATQQLPTLTTAPIINDSVRVQIRPWLLADAEFLMDFNVPINTKLVAFIGGVPRPLKAVELAHFFEQTYGHVVCVGIDIDNKFKYPRGSGRVAFSNYEAYVQAITDRYIVLDHEDIHKRVEIKPYFFHNQSCEECSGRYHRQHAPFFCPSLECFQYYCEPCWHKMHAHPSRLHHVPVIKGV